MTNDLTNEEIVTLRDACGLFPAIRRGKPAHISRLYRYTTAGCRGIRLEFLQCGATRCTTRQAISRFFRRLSEQAGADVVSQGISRDGMAKAAASRLDAEEQRRAVRRPRSKSEGEIRHWAGDQESLR